MSIKSALVSLFFTLIVLTSPTPAFADKSYGLPTLSGMPRKPHIIRNDGGIVSLEPWKMIIAPNTFTYDTYFQTGCWKKTFPMHIGRYWQLSDICEFRARPYSRVNKAPAVPSRSWVISYHYDDSQLNIIGGIAFPENSLKIVFSSDHGKSWTMLKSSVVNADTNTVAAITDKEGGFMVMGGFVNPKTYYNYKDVKGLSVVRGHEDETDEPQSSDPIRSFFEYIAFVLSYLF